MAYSTPPTVVTGDLWTAAQHNTYIRDNFIAGVPDIFTTKGDLAVASGADAAARLAAGANGSMLSVDTGATNGLRYAPIVANRKGGDAFHWNTGGTTDYDLASIGVRIEAGSLVLTIPNGQNGVASNLVFPVDFAYAPIVILSQSSNLGAGNKLVNLKSSNQYAHYCVVHANITDGTTAVGDLAVTVHWIAICER